MKKDLLNILICPKCKGNNLSAKAAEVIESDIIDGVITCSTCRANFEIKDSIPSFLPETEQAVEKEKIAHEEVEKSLKEAKSKEARPLKDFDFEYMLKSNFESIKGGLQVEKGQKILDIGSGSGWLIVELAKEGCKCIGLDIYRNFSEVYKADKKIKSNLGLVLADMNNTPFADEAFDVITVSGVIHHSYNMDKTIAEIKRLLKYGGRIAVTSEPISGLFKIGSRSSKAFPSLSHHSYTLFTYLKKFRKAGLQPQVFFPGYVDRKLLEGDLRYARFKAIAWIMTHFWRLPGVRNWCKKHALLPALVLFGIPLTMIVRKPESRA